jgi:predicted MFS family arabinose efflux permease
MSFVVGLAQAFGGPAYQAIVPALVPPRELSNAIALNSIQFNLARVIGPMLGGLALTSLGAAWCFGLNGLSYIAPVVALLLLQPRPVPQRSTSLFASLKEGLRFIANRESMPQLIVIAFLMTGLGVPLLVFIPVVVKDVFGHGPETFTWLLVTSGAGAVLGALVVAGLSHAENKGKLAVLSILLLGVLVAGFGLSNSLPLSFVLLFLGGAVLVACFALISSLVQLIVHDEMRGRVMSVYNVAFRGGMPFGALISGHLISLSNVQVVLAANGILLSGVALWFLLVERRVSRL